MTEAIDASTLHAQKHLNSMLARGCNGETICADMLKLGWPSERVMATVYSILSGATAGNELTPTQRATVVLCGGAVEDSGTLGGWRLNGRSADTLDVMRAANVALENFKMPLIKYPGLE